MRELKNTDGKSSRGSKKGEREIISCLMLINAILKRPADFWEYFSTTAERKTSLDESIIQLESIKLDILRKN